jgi:hypothetical protein
LGKDHGANIHLQKTKKKRNGKGSIAYNEPFLFPEFWQHAKNITGDLLH